MPWAAPIPLPPALRTGTPMRARTAEGCGGCSGEETGAVWRGRWPGRGAVVIIGGEVLEEATMLSNPDFKKEVEEKIRSIPEVLP